MHFFEKCLPGNNAILAMANLHAALKTLLARSGIIPLSLTSTEYSQYIYKCICLCKLPIFFCPSESFMSYLCTCTKKFN